MTWWRKCSVSWIALILAASTLLLPTKGAAYRAPEGPGPIPVNQGDPDEPANRVAKPATGVRLPSIILFSPVPGVTITIRWSFPAWLSPRGTRR